jgi:hypothetical protein
MTEIVALTESEMILGALQSLGTNADEVAETLRELGVTGRPSRARECPIANFVKGLGRARFGTVVSGTGTLWVYPPDVDYGAAEAETWEYLAEMEIPEPVCQFILKFDMGRFLNLVSHA